MPHGDGSLPSSPYVYESPDSQNRPGTSSLIRITVTYDNATRALIDATVYRDAICSYHKIYVGKGADGTPDSTSHVFNVLAGTHTITAAQLATAGFNTFEEFAALQITAGP